MVVPVQVKNGIDDLWGLGLMGSAVLRMSTDDNSLMHSPTF
jgi:short subunit fatty acids transporter